MRDFIGERYSLVFFTIQQYLRVPLDQRAAIPDYPTEERLQLLTRLLGPPRGYSDGLKQQSILQAFGLAAKKQALQWAVPDLCGCPPEVLARIADLVGPSSVAALSRQFRTAAC